MLLMVSAYLAGIRDLIVLAFFIVFVGVVYQVSLSRSGIRT